MKVKVLGTVSPYLRFDHNGPGFLIEDDGHKVLLDCGSGITRLLTFPYYLENLHVFISHFHRDHYNEIYNIQYASHVFHRQGEVKEPIQIHLPMVPRLRYEDVVSEEYAFANYYKIIDELEGVKVGNMTVTFCLTGHTTESYAFKVTDGKNTVVYTSDISFEAKELIVNFAKDVDLLICDSSLLESYGSPEINSHITAKQAAIIAKEANVQQLLLTHFWPLEIEGRYLEEAEQIFANVAIAREKMIIYFEEHNNNMSKKEKQFNPTLWKPLGIGETPLPSTPNISEGHNGFVEYQRPDDRYEVRGIMPIAPKIEKNEDVGKTGYE